MRPSSHPFSSFPREKRSREGVEKMNPWAPLAKRCARCSGWLSLDAFPVNRRMHLGRSSHCRECHRAATRDWRERNREQINAERRAAYRAEHPLPVRACVVCGGSFAKRPDALVCGPRCRKARKREQRRARREAA